MARRGAPQSSGISFRQLNRTLKRGDIDPVYLVVGEEVFLRNKAIEGLRGVVCGEDESNLAFHRIDGKLGKMAEFLDAARSLPLFLQATDRPCQLVVIRSFEPGTAAESELLAEYLDSPVSATCLVFEAPTLDSRRASAKLLTNRATKINCQRIESTAEVRRWIENSANARGFSMAPGAIDYLLEMVGLELQGPDPKRFAELWSDILDIPVFQQDGVLQMRLSNAEIRFVEAVDGRDCGIRGLDIRVADRQFVLEQAAAAGCRISDTEIVVCGTRFFLV